jgi:N-acetylmuramoyl-L-alanine amidase
MRKINKIILHCSASDARHQTAKMVNEWHKKRGWKKIGYHYFIGPDGKLEKGRKLEEIGAHCKGENSNSIGICLAGNMRFRPCQFGTLKRLLRELKPKFPKATVHGHNEFTINKLCPVFDVKPFKKFYQEEGSKSCWNILKLLMKLLKRF